MKQVMELLIALTLPVVVCGLGVVKLIHYKRLRTRAREAGSWSEVAPKNSLARVVVLLTGLVFTLGGGVMAMVVVVAAASGA